MPTKHPITSLPYFLFILSPLLQFAAGQYNVTNTVPNTPGGKRFDAEIGIPFTLNTMKTINNFVWKIFRQNSNEQRRNHPVVYVYISNLDDALGQTNGNDAIYISAMGLQNFPAGRAKFLFTSLMFHEMTHIFQWSGEGTAPGGLTEGIADYVMIKSNYYDRDGYTKPGEGNRWDEGYGVTARFLEYCDSLRSGFTADLNNMMRKVYKDEYFKDLLGKSLDQVWKEYKDKYKNVSGSRSGRMSFLKY